MNNKAIAWKTDDHFTAYKTYECSNTYQNAIDIMDDNGEMISVELEDKDFTFILNPSEKCVMRIENRFNKYSESVMECVR